MCSHENGALKHKMSFGSSQFKTPLITLNEKHQCFRRKYCIIIQCKNNVFHNRTFSALFLKHKNLIPTQHCWADWTLNLETSLLRQHRRHMDLIQNGCVSEQYVWLCQRHVIVAQIASSKNKAELAKISSGYKYSVTYIWPALDNSAYVTNSPSSLWVCRAAWMLCAEILSKHKSRSHIFFPVLFILCTFLASNPSLINITLLLIFAFK